MKKVTSFSSCTEDLVNIMLSCMIQRDMHSIIYSNSRQIFETLLSAFLALPTPLAEVALDHSFDTTLQKETVSFL